MRVGDDQVFGGVAGDVLPAFNAIGVKMLRSTKVTRNGAKRFAGVAESMQVNGQLIIAQAQKDVFEDFCSSQLTIPDLNSPEKEYNIMNVIIGRTLVGSNYELDLSKWNSVLSAQVADTVTSQLSRKK